MKKTPYGFMPAGRDNMQDGTYEKEETQSMVAYMKEAEVFIDIGAKVGQMRIWIKQLNTESNYNVIFTKNE